MDEAALISPSPVVSWQTSPALVQCASGKRGEAPRMVMFWLYRLGMFSYHTSASLSNMEIIKILGESVVARSARLRSRTRRR